MRNQLDTEKLSRSAQEQATASWVNYLNQLRLDTLLRTLSDQDQNLENAVTTINDALKKIGLDVVSTNRGGQTGMHGFIAEVAEVGVGNAREQVLGREPIYRLVDDNGPVDLIRDGLGLQLKFSESGGRFSLDAVKEHLNRYPAFVSSGAAYRVPKDHFETVSALHSMSAEDAGKLLSRSGEGPSMRDWQRVQDFFEETALSIDDIEPANFQYAEVQRGTYEATLESKKESLSSADRNLREQAHQESRPQVHEAMQATAVAAAVEGGVSFALAVGRKRKEGKPLKEFTENDWRDIAGESGRGFAKGGARGLSIYTLTNHAATSAAAASSMVTASFGIAEQAHRLRAGEINEAEFVERAELLSIEASVSALSSIAGQALIPIPVLGAVLGNTVGTVMYKTAIDALSKREQKLIEEFAEHQRTLDEQLHTEYLDFIETLNQSMFTFLSVVDRAFAPDVSIALQSSAELAKDLGVPSDEILDTQQKAISYFLN